MRPIPMERRFWWKVAKADGCWMWTGFRNVGGYGLVSTGPQGTQRKDLAHRVAWELTNGPIPDGMLVCHACDNPPCVRPDHLFLGTQLDNMRDASEKGRVHPGAAHGMSKLTEEDVRAIRAAIGTHADVAQDYGLSPSHVSRIRSRRSWGHVV